ncbi:CoA pyrophosphatase [Mesorhizobium sp.]|uniref:NUDIX hydrolase n=1 Tax=Mesorhizobium sp. TaxID=1871066 RepID=UPI0012068D1D|nr:CoA pyrophosphatase [Mesorhizobium sp.]TIO64335.1 MAG: CoA pyrophosphatase [Mesorhizobium sp.]
MTTYPFSPSFLEHIRSMFLQFAPWRTSYPENLKQAAVGIILVATEDGSGETAFLLTVRSAKMRSHAGQYALPGGRIDQGEDAVATVIRECMEEIGLDLSADQLLGALDLYATQAGYAITPVVFATTKELDLCLNPTEVDQVFRIKLSDLSGQRSHSFHSRRRRTTSYTLSNLRSSHTRTDGGHSLSILRDDSRAIPTS